MPWRHQWLRTVCGVATLWGASALAAAPVQRVVSLLPSATEAVCALGACERLVGADDFSLDPAHLPPLVRLGAPFQPQLESLLRLQPDLVLMGRSGPLAPRLRALGLQVWEMDTTTVEQVYAMLRQLDTVLGTSRAATVIAQMQAQLQQLAAQAQELPPQRVYVEVDAALYSAGPASFIGQLLQQLGARNIAPATGPAFPQLSPEYVVQQAPELIIQTHSAQAVQLRAAWAGIPAVQQGRICALSPEERRLVTRPGPRMAEAAAVFLRCLRMPFSPP